MIYLLTGPDRLSKDQFIQEIKNKLFKDKSAVSFDSDVFYCQKVSKTDFQESLTKLPVVAQKRLVILKNILKAKKDFQDAVLNYLSDPFEHIVLIFDEDKWDGRNAFAKKVKAKKVQTKVFGQVQEKSIFDMTNAMQSRQPDLALKHAHSMMEQGSHPLQMIGVILWFWKKQSERFSSEVTKKGLSVIQEADLNIKRSKLTPEQSLEVLIVKLCSLMNG